MSASPTVRVAAVQMDPQLGAVAANLATIEARIREAAAGGARLVVFPECALTGYGFDSRAEALAFAEPIPGPSTDALLGSAASWTCSWSSGCSNATATGCSTSATLLGPGGVVGTYRKIHLPFLGVDRFTDPGDRPLAIFEADGVRLGLHICYDGSFPETGRVLTLLGADVLIMATNWPIQSTSTADHLPACRAIENVVYVMAVDRVGDGTRLRVRGAELDRRPRRQHPRPGGADRTAILYADVDPGWPGGSA